MHIDLEDLKLTFAEWLELREATIIDVLCGAVIANEFKGDPTNLYIVGPPSSGKTELLRALNGYKKIYTISSMTPQTFISGIKAKGGSLLLNLKEAGQTILILKDFTTILEMRSESRAEILSQIREITDGYISKAFGTGKKVEWSGKLAIIAGVTPVIDRHHLVNQTLGERFLYYRIPDDGASHSIAEKARSMAGKEQAMRKELEQMTTQFLDQFKDPKIEKMKISDEINQKLVSLSCFIATSRTGVSRDPYSKTIDFYPVPEGPARLVKQLWTLGAGIAIVQAKDKFDEDVLRIIRKVGCDCLPSNKNQILRSLWTKAIHGDRWETTRYLAKLINYPVPTAKLHLEDLMMLQLLNRRIQGQEVEDDSYNWKRSETSPYEWQLSEAGCKLIRDSGVYGAEEDFDEHFDYSA